MLNTFSTNAISAKVKAMYGQRISLEQYKELTRRKNASEIAAYLRDSTHYRDILSDLPVSELGRSQLEQTLVKSRYNHLLELLRYAPAGTGEYYRYPFVRLEGELILQMIRLLGNGHAEDFVTQYPAYIERHLSFSLLELARVRTFDQLIDLLTATPYGELLRRCRPAAGESIDFTKCEAALKGYYYTHTEQLIDNSFRGKEREELRQLFGTQVELINISNIYRLKKYYPDTRPEQIQKILLPAWTHIPHSMRNQLLGASTAEEFLRRLGRTPLARYIGEDTNGNGFDENDQAGLRYRVNRKALRFSGSAAVAFTAYMVLNEIEVTNIIRIVEAVRYGIPPAEIENLLILT